MTIWIIKLIINLLRQKFFPPKYFIMKFNIWNSNRIWKQDLMYCKRIYINTFVYLLNFVFVPEHSHHFQISASSCRLCKIFYSTFGPKSFSHIWHSIIASLYCILWFLGSMAYPSIQWIFNIHLHRIIPNFHNLDSYINIYPNKYFIVLTSKVSNFCKLMARLKSLNVQKNIKSVQEKKVVYKINLVKNWK